MIHEYRLFEKIGCKVIFSFSFRAKETLEYFREKRVFFNLCRFYLFWSYRFNQNKPSRLLSTLLQKLIDHIFTLHLAPFASKLVNYSRHSESLNYVRYRQIAVTEGKCRRFCNSSECLKTRRASNN